VLSPRLKFCWQIQVEWVERFNKTGDEIVGFDENASKKIKEAARSRVEKINIAKTSDIK